MPPPSVIGLVSEARLDVLLQLSGQTLQGDLAGLVKHGIWRFSHELVESETGCPLGFREIRSRHPLTSVALLRWEAKSGAFAALHVSTIKTVGYSYVRAVDAINHAVVEWPARACRELYQDIVVASERLPRYVAPTQAEPPSTTDALAVLGNIAANWLKTGESFFARSDQWNVGIAAGTVESFIEPETRPAVTWLPELPGGRFIADPFAVYQAGHVMLLVEEFDPSASSGSISSIDVGAALSGAVPWPAIHGASHLAYPCLFEYDGSIFCVPDTPAVREIVLYRALDFPHQWNRVATLVEGYDAADPTIFRHGELWWLLATVRDGGIANGLRTREGGAHTILYGWYATRPDGPWIAHMSNPLKVDVRSSRPAGTPFVHLGRLYRPAQDCSRTYGGAVTINRVLALSPSEFREEPVISIRPYAHSRYPDGLHTVNSAGDLTVLDGKRETFVLAATVARIKRVMRLITESRG